MRFNKNIIIQKWIRLFFNNVFTNAKLYVRMSLQRYKVIQLLICQKNIVTRGVVV